MAVNVADMKGFTGVETTALSGIAASIGAAKRDRGFTLVELVVTVAVVGILASASYGSYQKHLLRVNRSATQQFMLEVMNRQELYLLDARAYANDIGDTGLGLSIPARVAQHYAMTITLTAGPPPGYVITATPSGKQATDGPLTLNSYGDKSPFYQWE